MLKKISGPRSDYPSHTYSMESIKIKKKQEKYVYINKTCIIKIELIVGGSARP